MADLTVTITEAITLNGVDQGGSYAKTVGSITDIYKRIVTVPASTDTTICSFKSTTGEADNSLDIEDVRYLRVTNLDASNAIGLSLQIDTATNNSAAADSATIEVKAGHSFIMSVTKNGIAVNSAAATLITALVDLESIIVDSGSNAVVVEVFIASE